MDPHFIHHGKDLLHGFDRVGLRIDGIELSHEEGAVESVFPD